MSRHVRRHKKIPGSVRKPTNDTIITYTTPLEGGSEIIFFNYPKYVGKNKESNGKLTQYAQEDLGRCKLVLKISETTHIYNSLVNSCKNAGFYLTDVGKEWNLLWTGGGKSECLKYMNEYQKVNHFPGSYQLGRKDLMWKNISRLKRQFGSEYNICPKTYIFPHDYRRFVMDTKVKETAKNYYIMKPVSASCGHGIKVINASTTLPRNRKNYLVSKYVSKPHLIRGYKYDMRIYVLVTSYDPLVIYMFKDGLVRFSTEKYSLKPKSLKKQYIHLTNYSVNKKAEKYNKNKGGDQDPCDDQKVLSKWSYQQLQKKISELGYDWVQIEAEIKDVIIKSIISVEPHVVHQQNMYTKNKNCCFELYGFDIILDHKLKPWLLEVNVSPSFSSSSPFDKNIKTRLICDTLTLIGIKPYDKQKYKREQEKLTAMRRMKGFTKGNRSKYGYFYDNKATSQYDMFNGDPEVLDEFIEQETRMGNFERIFPLDYNVNYYSQFLERERPNNELLRRHVCS